MAQHIPTGLDRYCDMCKRPLIMIEDDGIHTAPEVVMIVRHEFGEHGPLEILITQVWCTHCYPDGLTNY
jgi:hypothetical protein